MKRLLLLSLLLCGGCELQEVVTTTSEDVVIAEVYLRADLQVQTALLHRTRRGNNPVTVPGARICVYETLPGLLRPGSLDRRRVVQPRGAQDQQ